MSYILLKKTFVSGTAGCYSVIVESDDIQDIKNKLSHQLLSGLCHVDNLKIVQDVPFEFKCAVKILEESESV